MSGLSQDSASLNEGGPIVAVYLVTFRRHALLRRSLKSLLDQTFRRFVVHVVNDDPNDTEVEHILRELGDDRFALYRPVKKRGATGSFNLMFSERNVPFVALLEDDNWWEPSFLEEMVSLMHDNPDDTIVIANERIWRETTGGEWRDTGQCVWSFKGTKRHRFTITEICGSALCCNSAMLIRLPAGRKFASPPGVPVDVTEHFRDRMSSGALLLNGTVLVNYAETLKTARNTDGSVWGGYQALLIASTFRAAKDSCTRARIATLLWEACAPTSPRATSLVFTGLIAPEARSLVVKAPWTALFRTALWIIRRPYRLRAQARVFASKQEELEFLTEAPLTHELIRELSHSMQKP